ncbi:hypothetical protein [Kitasatospora brasiliensis]|uniref:hypothetical protein n=1 Tax=Kitasatospora brasiliensis TaxID=3058040 RepID=UPI00292CBF25|nr:hypothetical protein [Kitasatospora sp. K002]
MSKILALQGLEAETGLAAYTSTMDCLPPSHLSGAAHMRFELPVTDEETMR